MSKLEYIINILKCLKVTGSYSVTNDKDGCRFYCYPIPLWNIWHNNFSKLRSFGFSLGWLFWNCTFEWTYLK